MTLKSNTDEIGQEMYKLIADLYPICRSITGNGLRASLNLLKRDIPLEIHEIPTGTTVFDWTIPMEWNIRDAYIRNSHGQKVIDFQKSNLHVVNYSVPVKAKMSLEELKKHLFTLPDHPEWVPYRTTYYNESWGFCLSQKDFLQLEDGEYEVLIDSSLEPGYLSYGEYYVQGSTTDEVLISCHACHPSLCNDNVLKHSGSGYQVREFDPYGHDERQYCSPGINLPVGCFSRTPHGEFAEYHTSADNLNFVRPEYLADSFTRCLSVLQLLDNNRRYVNLNPMCEPQLGKRGLYRMMGGKQDSGIEELPLLWVLNLSDGEHSLLDISDRSGLRFEALKRAADALLQHGLLKVVEGDEGEKATAKNAKNTK